MQAWWWYALWATGGILSGTAPTICVNHYQCVHRLIVATLILEDLVTWSAFNVITIVTSYQDGDHLWSWLPPLSSLNLLIFSFNFNAKLLFANIWASFNCFSLFYLISCLVQSGFSNFNELRLVRKIFVNFRPTLDCEHFDSPCLGFSPKLKLLRIGVGRIIINTVQPSSSLLLSQTNYMLSEKLLASTRLLISAPIIVNISNLKMFKGAQAHNVQIETILWDSCLSFNSKWRQSWNELKLICSQLD